jgi:uncharacterized protein YkwD
MPERLAGADVVVMKPRLARITGILIAVGMLAAAPAAQATTKPQAPVRASAAAQCAGAGAIPTAATIKRATRATLCLLNATRAAHGLRRVGANRVLQRSAKRYAKAMVARHFFSHVAPNGQTLGARMSGYVDGARGWAYGENLAWGSGAQATPAQIMVAWMGSPGHRANILSARWRHIGIGIAPGAPVATSAPAASYVTHFGWRG